MSPSIHQEIVIEAPPSRVYEVLTSSRDFSSFTGDSAEISGEPGGWFSTFGGRIVGRNIELLADRRIVQAWRVETWEPGIYSIVKIELREQDAGTLLVLDHTGFPEEHREHL